MGRESKRSHRPFTAAVTAEVSPGSEDGTWKSVGAERLRPALLWKRVDGREAHRILGDYLTSLINSRKPRIGRKHNRR